MGRAVASSKSKKNSEEDRRKRKNPKLRKRRRVSLSPSSSSSDAEDISRRRRSSRRKPEKRRGRDPKRSVKRKSLKARHRSVSSASRDSSSSCSTCRSQGSLSRSRSPARGRDDRKRKFKKNVKRGRKLDRVVRSLRNRSRSLSCSTCSSGGSGPSQTHSYREGKIKEKDGSNQIGSSSVVESRGEVEKMYEGRGREMNDEMIMENYDDSQLPRANAGRDVDRVAEDRMMDEGAYEQGAEIDRWMSEGNVENDSYFDLFEDSGTPAFEPYKELELNTKVSSRIKSQIVAPDKHDSESDDLELMLRQKALENLKKIRGGLSSDSKTTDARKIELAGVASSEKQCETANKIISLPKSHSIVSKERRIQLGVPSQSHDSKVNPIMQLPSVEVNCSSSDKRMLFSCLNQSRHSKQLQSNINGQSTSNTQDDMEDSSEKMSHRLSPCRVSQEKNSTEGGGSGNSLRSEVNLGDELASGNTFTNGKEKIREDNEIVDECQSGSQFEKKTFSRMHEGEMVQVSYKVYIPKKTPALARRKLQR